MNLYYANHGVCRQDKCIVPTSRLHDDDYD